MGHCTYYLVKSENFSIEAENTPCPGFIEDFPTDFSNLGAPSCTKGIIIRYNGAVIKFKQSKELSANGVDVLTLPFQINGVIIQAASSIFIKGKKEKEIASFLNSV